MNEGGAIMGKVFKGAAKIIGGGIASWIGWDAGVAFFR